MKILLVDDTQTMRMLMTAILEDFGHEVISRQNGAEAVEEYLKSHPDLILMDVVMPVLDGYQAAMKIRAIENDCTDHLSQHTGRTEGCRGSHRSGWGRLSD